MSDYLLMAAKLVAALAAGMAILSGASLMSLAAASTDVSDRISSERQAELRNFLEQDCGSCHGLRMAGGLGPPLQAAAIENKPAQFLAATIQLGRPGTAMPPWSAFFSEEESLWLARELKGQNP